MTRRPYTPDQLAERLRMAARHEMTPGEIEEQRASFVRGITARCEHGVADFEQCEQCRAALRNGEGKT
jgi:hypothetical protein